MDLNSLPKFSKDERSSFKYWWAHYRAFNTVAHRCHAWKPKYLLHDIEKPFMRAMFGYPKTQYIHRHWNRHHIQYHNPKHIDYEGMAIDWECSQYTKLACPRNAYEEYMLEITEDELSDYQKILLMKNMPEILKKLGLWKTQH